MKSKNKVSFLRIAALWMALPGLGLAQVADQYLPLPLRDLSAFDNPPKGWKTTPEVMMNPNNSTVMSKDGDDGGVLVGTAGSKLTTRAKMQDLRLRFDFMLSPGAIAHVTLPGGARVRLADGGPVNGTDASTSGFVGQPAIQNATKAAGLWQTMELGYDASVAGRPKLGRINAIVLNDNVVQQGAYVPLNTSPLADGMPLGFEVEKGTVAFRNVGYQQLGNRRPLSLSNIKYKLYTDAWETAKPEKLAGQGAVTAISQELGNGQKEFHLFFEGDMMVEEVGDYTFNIAQSGPKAILSVDGKEVLAVGESTSQTSHSGSVNLSKGVHRFTLQYARFPWRAPALGLSVTGAGLRPYDLTALSSLPVPEPKPYLGIDPEDGPEMIRSFIHYQEEKYKRTHALSVGSPLGWHYSVDLNRGALLQAWRGPFAEVTEMWYERGEPQLLETAGLTVPISGQSSYAILANAATAWPDSADLNYLGYRLQSDGTPVLRYAMGSATILDHIKAEPKGLSRTVTVEGSPSGNAYTLLGTGKTITDEGEGLYRIDDRYYVRVAPGGKATKRTSYGREELMLPLAGKVMYSLFW